MPQEKFLVEVLYTSDAERKRIDYVVGTTDGSCKMKGYSVILPEEGVKRMMEKVPPEHMTIREMGKEVEAERFFDYMTETIELPPETGAKMFAYFLKSNRITRDGSFLRTKKTMAEITDLELSGDNPHITLRYQSSSSGIIARRLRSATEIYSKAMGDEV